MRQVTRKRPGSVSLRGRRNRRLSIEAVEDRILLSSFVVTDTLDDTNKGSLRWAIQQANVAGGEIDFNISGSGVQTINITSPLPALSADGILIDGTTQPGYANAGHPLIAIDGTTAGTGANGLQLASTGQIIKGLAIDNFNGSGVFVGGGGSSSIITQNYIGIDATGTTAEGNAFGVQLGSLANSCAITSNVISGNVNVTNVNLSGSGIYINGADSTSNTVSNTIIQGNLIGTDATGTKAVRNQDAGINDSNSVNTVIGGTTAAQRNIISGNDEGLALYISTGMIIEGNYIGPDITGGTAIGNNGTELLYGNGIILRGASSLQIGGTAAGSGNVISGNKNDGIDSFVIGSSMITVQGNFVGVDATGTKAMGNGGEGVLISGPTDVLIGGTTTSARNIVSNNGSHGIDALFSAIRWTIQGNYIGTDITATKIMGNGGDGISIWSPDTLLIGGTSANAGNVIVNNKSFGIDTFADGNGAMSVQGNFIGTDPTGTIAMGNGAAGVRVTIKNVTVGGTAAGAANVIANNGNLDAFVFSGVQVTSTGIPILSNSIYNNKQLGIDLNNGQGNNNQPAPVLTSATSTSNTIAFVGTLAAAPNTTYLIQAFSNAAADPSGAFEGQTFIGSLSVTTGSDGTVIFSVAGLPGSVPDGHSITATATDPAGNTSQFSAGITVVAPNADLAVTTAASATAINVGQQVTYTLTVTNNGPSDAPNAVLTDLLPPTLTFISATSSQGSTPIDSNGTVTANFGTIPAGSTVTVTIVVQATVSAPPTASSTVNVSSDQADNDTSNNTATILTTVNPLIDLALSGSGNPSPVLVGQNLTYTFTVTNNGPSPATGVIFTQGLPSGITLVSITPSVGTASDTNNQVTANFGNLAVNASATITVVVTVGATAQASMLSNASVTANETDSNVNNNDVHIVVAVTPVNDLSVGITATPAPVLVGRNLTYVVKVTNNGPSAATNVVLTQNLPTHAAFVSASSSTGSASQSNGVVTVNIGPVASGATVTLTVIVTPDAAATPSVTSTASAAATETDSNSANNSATVTTNVSPVTDLGVTITPSPSPVFVGQNLTYTVKVTNHGPSAATGVVLTDALPTSATFISANTDTGSAPTFSSGTLTTNMGNLAPGATATVSIIVTPTAAAPPSVVATAGVTGNEADTVSSNNTASVTTPVTPVADLAIGAASTVTSPSYVGSPVTYTIVLENHGPSTANSVVYSQLLPAGFTFDSVSSTVGTGSASSGLVTVNVGSLASGATATVTVMATPGVSSANISMSNLSVSSATADSDSSNNSTMLSTIVNPASDLALTLTPSTTSVNAGSHLTYTLKVKNQGPSDATGVVLTDTLPAGATLVSATADKGTAPVNANGVVTTAIGNLAAGATVTVTIVILPDVMSTSATNTASVVGNEADLISTNNSATVTTKVNPVADLGVTLTSQAGQAVTGSPFIYYVTVTNHGPSNATNVNLAIGLPAGVNFDSASPISQPVTVNNNIVTIHVGALNPGDIQSFAFQVTPVEPGNPTINVTATSADSDPVAANNSAAVATNIVTPPGTFAFSASSYTVDENAGVALITVNRLDGYQGTVTVHFATVPGGTAQPGVDFKVISQTLVFNQKETSETLKLPIYANPYDNHDETVFLQIDNPTGGAKLGSPTTALLTIHDTDPVVVGPTVTDIRLTGPAKAITQIDVALSGRLDPSTVTPLGFMVTEVGTFGTTGAGDNVPVALSNVSYDAGLGIVSLTPATPLAAGRFYQIRVVGTGPNAVKDLAGNPLNSTFGAVPGSDVVQSFARGTTLNYADENGAWVTLRIRGAGVIDLNRDANGHLDRLQLVGAVPRRTALTGMLHSGGGTKIGTILGMGRFGSVRRNLNIPAFQVANMPYVGGNLVDPPSVDTLLPTAAPAFQARAFKAFTQRKPR